MDFFYDTFQNHDIQCIQPPYDDTYYYDIKDVLAVFFKSARVQQRVYTRMINSGATIIEHDDSVYIRQDDLADALLSMPEQVPHALRDVFVYDYMGMSKPSNNDNDDNDDDVDYANMDTIISSESIEEEENDVSVHPTLSPEQIQLYCVVLNSLCNVYSTLSNDGNLRMELQVQMTNIFHVLESELPLPPLYQEDNSQVVRVTQRVRQLLPRIPKEDIRAKRQEVGQIASDLHQQRYRMRPPQYVGWANGARRPINRYTEHTAPHTLDEAIYQVFHTNDN